MEKMNLKHVALVCRSEENSDRFYQSLLGLPKLDSKMLPAQLSKQLFEVDSEIQIISYGDDELGFEIFIFDKNQGDSIKIEHVCLAVEDRSAFLDKCRTMNVKTIQVPKGNAVIVFIQDYDGNLFEIK